MPPDNTIWIFLSLAAPMFWAVSNIIDQFLVRGEFDGTPWIYTFFQGVFYLPLVLLFPLFMPSILETRWQDGAMLMIAGAFWLPAVGLYMMALKGDDASVAVPIFNLIPLLNLIAAWLLLGEVLTIKQILSGVVLVLAATAITWDFHAKRLRFKTLFLMLASCFAYLAYGLIARHQVNTMHWAAIYFWYGLGFSFYCAVITLVFPRNRRFFINFIQKKSHKVIGLCVFQSWLDVMAVSLLTKAISLAPSLPMVSFVSAIQPLYIVIASGIAAFYFPKAFSDKLEFNKILLWKITCITVMLTALYGLLLF